MAASVGLAKFNMKTGQVVYIGGAWASSLDAKIDVLKHVRWLNKSAQPPGIVFIPWESNEDWTYLYPKMVVNESSKTE
jgi:hypothetical protein